MAELWGWYTLSEIENIQHSCSNCNVIVVGHPAMTFSVETIHKE